MMNTRVEEFISSEERWHRELEKLREIILDFPLNEEVKWGVPCYTYQKSNVVLIHTFKEYCAMLFFKGALLHDDHSILIRQTENVQSARQVRFTGIRQITELEPVLRSLIQAAIEIEKSGLKVEFRKTAEYNIPEEFQSELDKRVGLNKAFNSLTPGRQRAYILYFSSPKLAKTRKSRVVMSVQKILEGKGLNDL